MALDEETLAAIGAAAQRFADEAPPLTEEQRRVIRAAFSSAHDALSDSRPKHTN
ncbi:MAG: hypothetical protein K0R62_8241 [Nonomuraea muscovyensis]|jgi:hypothetical protein|nr:hypothetical protein [Nonomuraea muscovyensis]